LTDGVQLTDAQAEALGNVTGMKLTGHEPRFQNHFVLDTRGEDTITLESISSAETIARSKLASRLLREKLGRSPQVIVRGPVSEELAGQWNDAGVYFVRELSDSRRDPLPVPAKKVRLIMVASDAKTLEGRKANRTIYEIDGDVGAIEKAVEVAADAGARFAP